MTSWRSVALAALLAVFALAIGVILGSGPLRTALVGQTAQEADALRGEIADREAQLIAQQGGVEILERYLTELNPITADERLAGQTIALVVEPGATAEQVAAVADAIADSGGTVAATAMLGESWLASEQGAFRAALAQELVEDVGITNSEAGPEAVLHAALIQSLVPSLAVAGAPPPAEGEAPQDPAVAQQRAEVLEDVLTRAELVATAHVAADPELPPVDPTVVVIIAGPGDPDLAQRAANSGSTARLALAFIDAGLATVIATEPVVEADISSVVAGAPGQFSKVSVAADAWGAAGPIVVVLAAQEQLGTGSGLYGDPAREQLVPVP